MKFVHAADLHLDSPMRGLPMYDGAPIAALRGATRAAFRNLIDLCNDAQAGLLLLAGDLFDGPWKDHKSGLFFASELARLAATRVVIVRGNHDAASSVTLGLKLPNFVTTMRADSPQSCAFEDCGVAVHGQSFRQRAVKDDLAKHYPAPIADLFNIGILHTSLDGREGHEPYAPTTLATLLARGYDYWALGHVHARELVHSDPPVLYPGNLQGRHIRECGAKGATLVHVAANGRPTLEPRALDTVRWFQVRIALDKLADSAAITDAIYTQMATLKSHAEGRVAAFRLTLHGASQLATEVAAKRLDWINSVRAMATEIDRDHLYVEDVKLSGLGERTADSSFANYVHDTAIADALRARPMADDAAMLESLLAQLPASLQAEALELRTPEARAEFVAEVRARLLGELGREVGSEDSR